MSGTHPLLPPPADQANTALAETPGSRFTGECEALLREERYGDLMDKFAQHLDLVLSKAGSDQGAVLRGAGAVLEWGRRDAGLYWSGGAAGASAALPHPPAPPARPPRPLRGSAPLSGRLLSCCSCLSNADVECCLNITCHLVPRIPGPQGPAAAKRLAAALAAKVWCTRQRRSCSHPLTDGGRAGGSMLATAACAAEVERGTPAGSTRLRQTLPGGSRERKGVRGKRRRPVSSPRQAPAPHCKGRPACRPAHQVPN